MLQLTLIYSYEINPIFIENRRWDPLTGILSASVATGSNMLLSTGELIYNPYKEYRRGRSLKPSGEGSLRPQSVPISRSSTNDSWNAVAAGESNIQDRTDNAKPNGNQAIRSLTTAGNMASATMKGFGKFTGTYFKGVVVDIPHAAAEGFRQVPKLYGEQPKEYGTVKDWKFGAVFGGKNFIDGMSDGFTGLFTEPVKGAKAQGVVGAAKGFMKGTIGLATKVPSGM